MRTRPFSQILLALTVFWSSLSAGFAASMPENHVLDQAHLLSASTLKVLSQLLVEHEQITTDRIAVAILSSREPSPDLETRAKTLFEDWEMNSREHQSGVLIILAWKEKEARIELNARVHSILSDSQIDDLIQGRLIKRMESHAPSTGILETTTGILEALDSPLVSSGRMRTLLQDLPSEEKKPVIQELASAQSQTVPTQTVFGVALAIFALGLGVAAFSIFRIQHRDAHFTHEGWYTSTLIEDLKTKLSHDETLGGIDGSW